MVGIAWRGALHALIVCTACPVRRDVMEAVAQVPGGRGLGVFYWEPAWLGVKGAGWRLGEGNAWENQAMFDFEGNARESLHVFGAVVER